MFKSSTNDSFVMKHEIKCDSLRANEIYAEKINGPTSTVDFTIIDSITGHIENFTCVTGHIDNFSSDTCHIDNFTCVTGHIDNFSSDTGDFDIIKCNNLYSATGINAKDITATGNIIATSTTTYGTGSFGNISATGEIYAASSFIRDPLTSISVPNICSMYQYLATGPTSITITNSTYIRLNSSLGSGIRGSSIPVSAFSPGSLFEFYFAGSFTATTLKSGTNIFVGIAKQDLVSGPVDQVTWLTDDVFPTLATSQTSAKKIDVRSKVQRWFEPLTSSRKLRIQSITDPNKYQIFDVTSMTSLFFTSTFIVTIDKSNGNDFDDDEDVIVKYDDEYEPAINVNLTFSPDSTDATADFFCQTNLQNTIYYAIPHSFSTKSVFQVIGVNTSVSPNTISIVSSNSGSILINDNNYNSNSVNRPFNTYERTVSQNNISFPITSNTVYPHILFYTYAQDILLTVNNYYLRRIA